MIVSHVSLFLQSGSQATVQSKLFYPRRLVHECTSESCSILYLQLASQAILYRSLISHATSLPKVVEFTTGTADAESLELEGIAESLRKFDDGVNNVTENEFSSTSKACKEVTNELLQAIPLTSIWNKEKIRGLRDRLNFLGNQVTFDFVGVLCAGQESISNKIEQLQTSSSNALKELRENAHRASLNREEEFSKLLGGLDKISVHSASMPTKEDLKRIADTLTRSFAATEVISKEVDIIHSLQYSCMLARHSRIPEARSKTFHWIFDAERLPMSDSRRNIGFKSWLETKNGIFWISGKPGSGKSTLMNSTSGALEQICDNPMTRRYWRRWAGASKLNIAEFYFWSSGTDMQRSTQGLLQSIIYEILRQCPDLIPRVCRQRWFANELERTGPWSFSELNRSFECLQGCASTSQKVCFFIDGLDEYEGEHLELHERLLNIDALGDADDRKIYMQELTKNDIEVYSIEKLSLPAKWASKRGDQVRHRNLAMEIFKRAQGVFLWVYLVVRLLQDGLINGDDISLLENRLKSLPTDLDAYFSHIMHSIENLYLEKLACMLRVTLAAKRPLSLMTYSFLDKGLKDQDFAIKLPHVPFTVAQIQHHKSDMRRRINAISKGLLEVSESRRVGEDTTRVEFLHRNVHDFLCTRNAQSNLDTMAPETVNIFIAISRPLLARLKVVISTRTSAATTMQEICNILDYASLAEEQRELPDRPAVSELVSIGEKKFGHFLERRTIFLEYAVRKGLVHYVREEITQYPHLVPSHGGGSLLLNASLGIQNSVLPSSVLSKVKTRAMLEVLLQAGINPNAKLGNVTIFGLYLRRRNHELLPEEFRHLLGVLLLAPGINLLGNIDQLLPISKSRDFDAVLKEWEEFLSHGFDPNILVGDGRSFWTGLLEHHFSKGCWSSSFLSEIRRVAILFLRYGADPFAACYFVKTGGTLPAFEVLEKHCCDDIITEISESIELRDKLKSILKREMEHLRSRDSYVRKRKRSSSLRPRKRLRFGD
ncbi:hypothetical protein HYALB_00001071 [Hymenoscyphus albidus]|uniref:NACHT domain-containing protein n=1 Tax=Hymenoscyphus albidus TaxID=595503 RepID=A0A9N9LWY5_9HELO|nr:hypothetical protein HYALB_00001071 [Hymenoscyphus albidus]